MVESKKALPKEPRLSYYSSYTNPYYGGGVGAGHSQLSPPGTRNYYGPPSYPGPGGYMNGNRFYQHHPHFQVPTYIYIISLSFLARAGLYTTATLQVTMSSK